MKSDMDMHVQLFFSIANRCSFLIAHVILLPCLFSISIFVYFRSLIDNESRHKSTLQETISLHMYLFAMRSLFKQDQSKVN